MVKSSLENIRHSLAHLLGAAVLELYPGSKLAIGPAINDGFYYDIDVSGVISDNDLPKIEKKMREILKTWRTFEGREVSPREAKELFKDNPYKKELIDELVEKGEKITLYASGSFTDLCRGGHVENAREIDPKAFKLSRVAGAYWRGSEKNPQLTRIYGYAFETKDELQKHLVMLEEAKKRDHRKLGRDLELFTFDDLVGKGLPLWLPNGTLIKDLIEKLAVEMEKKYGYVRVSTPHLAKEELFITSGHLPYYKDSMYPPMKMDDGNYYLKAMNCPHHHVIYKSRHHSYRDLPIRMAEYGTVYRNELSGTLAGLLRVRMLSMNDAHIYCTRDQTEEELKKVLELTMEYFEIFGLKDYWFRLSKWNSENKEKYINEPENWNYAESVLRKILKDLKVKFVEADDEAAFYGPKVDVQFKSAIGREETMSTIQLDFAAKKRFGLSYIDAGGKENNEVFVIHRAPLSTHERFMAFLIEHYAGAFPVWLSPVQATILPISDKQNEWATGVYKSLNSKNIRVEINKGNETLGKKIREAELKKIPYILVIGEKEEKAEAVAVRARGKDDQGQMKIGEFVKKIKKEIKEKK